MGHLLATVNPEAADRSNGGGRPMPGVGEPVLYHPRAGEVRQGRKVVPAIVLAVDTDNRLLELLIIHAADDMITQNRVAEHVEGDRGWSRLPASGDAALIETMQSHIERLENWNAAFQDRLMSIFGDFLVPKGESVMSLIDKLDGRIGELEDASGSALTAAQQSMAPVKRGRGRSRRSV